MQFKLRSIAVVLTLIIIAFLSGLWIGHAIMPTLFIVADGIEHVSDIQGFLNSDSMLADAIRIDVGDDIQTIVDEAPPQSVFLISAGIHRLQRITPRNGDQFIGEIGAVLNGAMVLNNGEQNGDYWIIENTRFADLTLLIGGTCITGYTRCNHAYDLYVDHHPLRHVDSIDQVDYESWFFDYDNNRIIMGQPTNNRLIELSVVFHAFQGEATDVLIENLTIEKYGGFGQLGAIRANNATNWIIRNNTIQLNAAAGINFGHGMQIINNRVIENGQIGISGEGDGVSIIGNEIAFNNYANYDAGWEAGATKFVSTNNLLVRSNYVHSNNGQGLWTDIDNINTTYEYNLVLNNTGTGILHEISYDAHIRNNIVRYNAYGETSVYSGGQIMLSSSGNVEVYNNDVVAGSAGGNSIVIIQQARGNGIYGAYQARNNYIHDNQIVILNEAGETAAATDIGDVVWFWEENTFTDNRYYGLDTSLALWGWQNRRLTWEEFRAFQQDEGTFADTMPISALVQPSWQAILPLSQGN